MYTYDVSSLCASHVHAYLQPCASYKLSLRNGNSCRGYCVWQYKTAAVYIDALYALYTLYSMRMCPPTRAPLLPIDHYHKCYKHLPVYYLKYKLGVACKMAHFAVAT